jgi:hypothetical protein
MNNQDPEQIVGPISYEAVAKGLQKNYSLAIKLWLIEQKRTAKPYKSPTFSGRSWGLAVQLLMFKWMSMGKR